MGRNYRPEFFVSPPSLKARALQYLSRREHSRTELRAKLARYATPEDDLDALLDELQVRDWLYEERFVESLVRRCATRYGTARIPAELKQHGVDGSAYEPLSPEQESANARAILHKKFSDPPTDATARAKQMRFLQQRGFSPDAIRAALKSWDETGLE